MHAKHILILLVLVVSLCSVNLVPFAADKQYVFKLAHVSPTDPYAQPTSAMAAVFKSQLETISGGRIKVEIYPAGQLGDQRSLIEQVRNGTVEIASAASGVFATAVYPNLTVLDIPYLFQSTEVAWNVLSIDNPFTKKLIEDVRKKTGLRILSFEPMGFRHFTNSRRPIKTPEDLKGLKIRVMEAETYIRMLRAIGALPTPIPFTELYTSLQTGVVDGQENPLMNIQASKFYEVQKYLTLNGHVLLIAITYMNDNLFRSLPSDLQQAVIEAVKASRIATTGLNYIIESTALDFLKSKGMEIYTPNARELVAFKKVGQKEVLDWIKTKVDPTFLSDFMREIEKAEQKLKSVN